MRKKTDFDIIINKEPHRFTLSRLQHHTTDTAACRLFNLQWIIKLYFAIRLSNKETVITTLSYASGL